jgi:hypothetical protein
MNKIAHLEFDHYPLLLAPMEDVSDPPFRYVCKMFGADVVYSEFISADGMNVTAAFERYARPLIDGEVSPTYQGGVPHHIKPLDGDRA